MHAPLNQYLVRTLVLQFFPNLGFPVIHRKKACLQLSYLVLRAGTLRTILGGQIAHILGCVLEVGPKVLSTTLATALSRLTNRRVPVKCQASELGRSARGDLLNPTLISCWTEHVNTQGHWPSHHSINQQAWGDVESTAQGDLPRRKG